MRISKFQLKLTLIFLLLLLIPATIATLFTRYILTKERKDLDLEKVVEAVLQDARDIAYDMIDEVKAECQFVAEDISSYEDFVAAFSSTGELENPIADIMPPGSDLLVIILDFRTDSEKGVVKFSTAEDTEDVPYFIIDSLKQEYVSQSYLEGDMAYGIAPILEDGELIGAAVAYQKLKQELVRNVIGLQNLLKLYTIEPDLTAIMWTTVISLIVVLAVTGGLLGWLITRSITKPILSLVAGTQEVAKGNLDYKIEVKSKDEIAILVEAFNSMISQVKTSREREVRAERLAAWREVARRIAHEIKNPLTPIQLSMYRLRKNLGSEKYDEIFQQAYTSITNEVENLRNMVTEFSDFARMPKPRVKLADPRQIVQDAIDLYTGLPDDIILSAELADNLPQVMADDSQIRQALHNLIGNAVEAMSDGGQLSVTMELETDDTIAIQISDTGCGMSEETRQRMFTPYFTTKETGTGLGMAITAQIIEEHGGEISVDSEEGVGTTVVVRLKVATDSEVTNDTEIENSKEVS